MQKTIYGQSRWAGDVFYNKETKETTLVLNLGFAGKMTLYITAGTIQKGEQTQDVLVLTKAFINNGVINQVRVGSLFKTTSKNGTEYFSGSFGLGVFYDKEKQKTLTTKENEGINLQLFKLAKDKHQKISEDVVKFGFVNMQVFINQHNENEQESIASQDTDDFDEKEIPF